MKKTLLIAAALSCSGAVAWEKQVWACQELQSVGMNWENGSWQGGTYEKAQALFTLDGVNSILKVSTYPGPPFDLSCRYRGMLESWYCLDDSFARTFIINPASGSAGYSVLFGAADTSYGRDTIRVSALQCTKF